MSDPTHIKDVLAALGFLPPESTVTISVSVQDLRVALEKQAGGPDVMTAELAALHVGRTAEFWRRAAAAGEIAGAWQDAKGGPWRLPRAACEAHIRALQHRGRRVVPIGTTAAALPFDGGKARGPRKAS